MPDLPWFVYAVPLAMVGLIGFAAFYKWLEVRAAAEWPKTTGRVVVSTSQARKVRTMDSDRQGGAGEETRNFANIVYEYTVSGQKLRNNRVSIGEDLGNFEVEETIARYPVGKIVTVYYNPRAPREAVLERDVPEGLWGCVIWMVVIGTVGILGSFFGFNQLTEYARQYMADPARSGMVIGLAAMGAFAFLFGLALRKRGNEAGGWPKVTGRIVRSELDEFRGRLLSRLDTPITTLYRPLISFAYEYNGIAYTGDQVSLGAKVTANTRAFANKLIAKYPLGAVVEVHVNPQNPSEAVLQSAPAFVWLPWVAAVVLWGLAIFIAQQP